MKVTAPARVYLVALGDWVEGDIDVPDDVGASLLEQGWKPAKSKPKRVVDAEPATAEQED